MYCFTKYQYFIFNMFNPLTGYWCSQLNSFYMFYPLQLHFFTKNQFLIQQSNAIYPICQYFCQVLVHVQIGSDFHLQCLVCLTNQDRQYHEYRVCTELLVSEIQYLWQALTALLEISCWGLPGNTQCLSLVSPLTLNLLIKSMSDQKLISEFRHLQSVNMH